MGRLDTLKTIPIGSLLTLSEAERDPYFTEIARLPASLKNVLTAVNTGAFTRGLVRAYGVALTQAPKVALVIVRLMLGRMPLVKLPGVLAVELSLPDDSARRMATEIERDLIGPVRGELEQYWQTKAGGAGKVSTTPPAAPAAAAGARNVLNLKETPKLPPPPPMPRGTRD